MLHFIPRKYKIPLLRDIYILAAATGIAAGSIMDAETAYTHSFLNILLFILKTSS